MSDLDQMFAQLSTYADRSGLAAASTLRAVGTRRRRTRTTATLAAVVLVMVGGLGAGLLLYPGHPGRIPTPAATRPNYGGPCTSADLTYQQGSTAGTHVRTSVTLQLRNTAGRDCVLRAPTLWGTVGGVVVRLPQHAEKPTDVLLGAGRDAAIRIDMVDGDADYQPADPGCQPATYTDVQLDLGDAGRSRTGVSLTIKCGDATVRGWLEVQPAACTSADFSRSPAVTTLPGVVGYQVALSSSSMTGCQLAEPPTLRFIDAAGASGSLTGQAGSPPTLRQGGTAVFAVSMPANGAGCTSPVSYRQLTLDSGDLHLDIPGTMEFPCAGAQVSGWGTEAAGSR